MLDRDPGGRPPADAIIQHPEAPGLLTVLFDGGMSLIGLNLARVFLVPIDRWHAALLHIS